MAKLTWHGHACFEYETREGKILIDPFLSNNPKADIGPDDVEGIDAIDPELTLRGLAILHAEVSGGQRMELGLG